MKNAGIQRYLVDWRQRMGSSAGCFDDMEETMSSPAISEGMVSRNMKLLGYEYLSARPDCTFEEFESAMLADGSPLERHVNHLKTWHSWKINFFHRVFTETYLMWKIANTEAQIFYGSDRGITEADVEGAYLLGSASTRALLPPGIVAVRLPDYVASGYFCAVFFVPGFPPIGLGRRGVVLLDFSSPLSFRSLATSVKLSLPMFSHAIAYAHRTVKELYN